MWTLTLELHERAQYTIRSDLAYYLRRSARHNSLLLGGGVILLLRLLGLLAITFFAMVTSVFSEIAGAAKRKRAFQKTRRAYIERSKVHSERVQQSKRKPESERERRQREIDEANVRKALEELENRQKGVTDFDER